jgi:hypothetical protein
MTYDDYYLRRLLLTTINTYDDYYLQRILVRPIICYEALITLDAVFTYHNNYF